MDHTERIINIYSDETNHLKDATQGNCMVIGSIWCEKNQVKELAASIRKVKEFHGYRKNAEVKWTKISPANVRLYEDLIKLFFVNENVNFRAIVVPKDKLNHELFHQTDEDFYYKTQYMMITNIVRNNSPAHFNVYIDYKDVWSNIRSKNLEGYLKKKSDFSNCGFNVQPVRSHESELLQLADILIGATSYRSNHFKDETETPKARVMKLIEQKALQRLNQKTPPSTDKVNIFMWSPKE